MFGLCAVHPPALEITLFFDTRAQKSKSKFFDTSIHALFINKCFSDTNLVDEKGISPVKPPVSKILPQNPGHKWLGCKFSIGKSAGHSSEIDLRKQINFLAFLSHESLLVDKHDRPSKRGATIKPAGGVGLEKNHGMIMYEIFNEWTAWIFDVVQYAGVKFFPSTQRSNFTHGLRAKIFWAKPCSIGHQIRMIPSLDKGWEMIVFRERRTL